MCTKVLAEVIKLDVTSRTAASVRTNPKNAGKFPTDADVPPYLYKCAGELLLGIGFDPIFFADTIIYKYGSDVTDRDSGIDLMTEAQESVFAAQSLKGDMDDDLGAELSLVRILCHVDRVQDATEDNIRQLDLRVRYLLDAKLRAAFKPPGFSASMPAVLNPAGIDNSIDPEFGVEVEWLKQADSDNKKERISLYRCQYVRIFAS